MKDILVEFTEKGAIIHKDPLVISEKKSLPFCFLNPDLSEVNGISPSYWDYTSTGKIVPASSKKVKQININNEYGKNPKNFNESFLEKHIKKQRKEIIIHRFILTTFIIMYFIGVIKL